MPRILFLLPGLALIRAGSRREGVLHFFSFVFLLNLAALFRMLLLPAPYCLAALLAAALSWAWTARLTRKRLAQSSPPSPTPPP